MNVKKAPNDNPVEKLSYEDAMVELERIVTLLESDNQTLEISLHLFERGQALAKHCAGLLDKADQRVRQLVGENMQPFSPDDER